MRTPAGETVTLALVGGSNYSSVLGVVAGGHTFTEVNSYGTTIQATGIIAYITIGSGLVVIKGEVLSGSGTVTAR